MKEKKDKRTILGRLQKTPLWKKEEFSEIEYEPTTVKDLMTEMKNISELIIDLAYSAVLFYNKEIAEEVKYLEVRMDKLNYDIRIMAMMAARTKEDAEQLAGILQVAQASEKISNTAGDIVLLLKDKNRPILSRILNKADEKIFRVKISSNSEACEKKIGELKIESETGMRIIAIRRNNFWIYNPQSYAVLKANDWLISRGSDEGYNDLDKFLKGKLKVLE
ncbi:potassium channel family protein [Thermoplasmatota archaeon]